MNVVRECLGRNKRRLCLLFTCTGVVLVPLGVLTWSAVMFNQVSRPTKYLDATSWPVRSKDGLILAYKEDDRWMNWWARDRHSGLTYLTKVASATDHSDIPSDESELDKTLPVKRPYWINGSSERPVGAPGIRATWLGHASVLAEVDSVLVLTDPIFSQRASPIQWMGGPKRYRPPACTVEELPDELKAVLISHNHFDHLDSNSVKDLHKKYGDSLHWYVPMDMGSWFSKISINSDNVHEMVWWDEQTLPGTSVKIAITPSNHGCRRGLLDEDKALWGSWAVIGPKHNFWFGGDTAYADAFKQIGDRYGPFHLSAVPIGAYHPRWFMKFVHVDPGEAVSMHQDLRSRRSLGIHWGTFKMTTEFYLEPPSRLKEEAEKAGLGASEFGTVNIGETMEGAFSD